MRKYYNIMVLTAIVLVLFICGIVCFRNHEKNDTLDASRQIESFVQNKHEWSDMYNEYFLTVADINQDGKWELIVDSIQGTGKFANNDYFIIDKPKTVIKLDKDDKFGAYLSSYYESKEGLVSVPVYFDENKNVYYSIQGTGYRDDPATFVNSIVSIWLENNKVEEETLANKICRESEEGNSVITYKNVQGKKLTKQEFETIAKQRYQGLTKMQMKWKWQKVKAEQIADMSDKQLTDLLIDSCENFKIVSDEEG